MWQTIRELVASGVTIFLTTQYLEEADRLAHRIGVLDKGVLVAEGTPDELKRLVPGGHIRLSFGDAAELERAAQTFDGATRDDESLTLQVPSDGGVDSLRALLDQLEAGSIDVGALSVQTADLDDVFLSLTGDARRREGGRSHDHIPPGRRRLGDDAAAQPAPDAPLPVADALRRRHPGRASCCCSCTCSAARSAPASDKVRRRSRRATSPT